MSSKRNRKVTSAKGRTSALASRNSKWMRPRVSTKMHVAPKDAMTPGVPPCASPSPQVNAGRQSDIAETALHDCPALLASSPSASIQRLTAAASCNFDRRRSMRVPRLSQAR
jgi:hypothetical protein